LSGKIDWYKPFLTSDGNYFAVDEGLFELVGDTFKDRITDLKDAKMVLAFQEMDCIGWNPVEDLVAFKRSKETAHLSVSGRIRSSCLHQSRSENKLCLVV